MKHVILAAAFASAAVAFSAAGSASAGQYVIHLHGRGNQCWPGSGSDCSTGRYVPSVPGWTNVTLTYNGSDALESSVDGTVRSTIQNYCGSGHSCVVHCYSAGCLRMLKAVSDLRATGNSVPGLLWAEASASAAGGTKLASTSTSGLTGFAAKLFGQQEKIDYALTIDAARNRWGYVQDDMGANIYHLAGNVDICKTVMFTKLCGNRQMNNGSGDGAVAFDSAAGYSTSAAYTDACGAGKYPFRIYDTSNSPCAGIARDHMGIPEVGMTAIAKAYSGSYTNRSLQWSDPNLPASFCSNAMGECDRAFSNTNQSVCTTPSGTPVAACATNVSNTKVATSGLTCAGKCGGTVTSNGVTCACDPRCVSRGDCCGDYSASNCPAFNQTLRAPIHRGSKNGTTFYSHSIDDLAKVSSPQTYNAFFLYPVNAIPGTTTPLYRCRFSDGKYMLSSASSCYDSRRGVNGVNEVLIGYQAVTSWDNTITLYELYNTSSKDRIYTTSTTERSSLLNSGWVNGSNYLVWAN
jgi:hypothetical protein